MTAPLAPWPDVERIVAARLADLAAAVGTETPADLQNRLPFVQVDRIGGDDNRITDAARVDVHVYAAGASQAKAIAEAARQRLISGPSATAFGRIDHAATESAPQTLPVDDPDIRHVVATYRVTFRRNA